jgi:microcin C transport system substrate-binding protein
VPPVSDGSGQDRTLLRKASQLLLDAGCPIKDGKRRLPNGDVFKIEFLNYEPSFQPHHAPYIKNLGTLGIDATLRIVDPVQYRARMDDFDFDVAIERFSMASTPGDALRTFFSSQAADIKGSQNLAGIKNPALDALIERIIAADNRDEYRIAYWDVFAHPPNIPRYAGGVGAPDLWWQDDAKARTPEQAKPEQAKPEQAK